MKHALLFAFISLGEAAYAQSTVQYQYQTIPKSSAMYATSFFGRIFALEGDLLVTSDQAALSPTENRPVVAMFTRTERGWNLSSELPNPSGVSVQGGFGFALGLDGNTLAIASPTEGTFGAVYVYERDGSGNWGLAQIVPSPFQGPTLQHPRAQFGYVIDLQDGELIVSAPSVESGGLEFVGRVYCFRRTTGGWQLSQTLEPDPSHWDGGLRFGRRVVRHGDTLMVSTSRWPRHLQTATMGFSDAGSVYHYERIAGGAWTLVDILVNATGNRSDRFGEAVALDNETLAIGKPQDPSWPTDISEVIIYRRTPSRTWSAVTSLRASNALVGGWFGCSLALENSTLAVGAQFAPGSSVNPAAEGGVYVFRRNVLGNWPTYESERLVVEQGNTYSFGMTVALDQGTLVGGATGGFPAQAALFLFAQGQEDDIYVPAIGSAAVGAHIDLHGDAVAGSGNQNILLSRCAPSSRYLVLASLAGNGGGCGTTLGGVPLCLCGPLQRAAFGQLGPTDTLKFVDLPVLHPLAQRLFSQIGSVYLQAYIAEPGGLQHAGLTNAVRIELQ